MEIQILPFTPEHWPAVAVIYQSGIESKNATFETEVPAFDIWNSKFYHHLRWVAMHDNAVVGWAGLMPVSARKVYAGVAEVTIYIDPKHAGKGVGKKLMQYLIDESEKAGIWTLYSALFPENMASVRLHEASGFRRVGYREKVAQLDGVWRDTLAYERRSRKVGV